MQRHPRGLRTAALLASLRSGQHYHHPHRSVATSPILQSPSSQRRLVPWHSSSRGSCRRGDPELLLPQRSTFHTSAARYYDTPSSSPATQEKILASNKPVIDPVSWASRIAHKKQYAENILHAIVHSQSPQFPQLTRSGLLRIAEAELEEESWIRKDSSNNDVLKLPPETKITEHYYEVCLKAMKGRRELLACSQLMEDWIRFAAIQKQAEDQARHGRINKALLSDVVLALASRATNTTSLTKQESHVWLGPLNSLLHASRASELDWDPPMLKAAGKAFCQGNLLIEATQLLAAQLKIFWDGLDGSSPASDGPEFSQKSAERDVNALGGQLAAAFHTTRRRLSSPLPSAAAAAATEEASSSALLQSYLQAVSLSCQLLADGFLPLPSRHQENQRIDPMVRFFEELCRFPEVACHIPQRLPSAQSLREYRATASAALREFLRQKYCSTTPDDTGADAAAVMNPSSAEEEEAKASSRRQRRLDHIRSARLSPQSTNTLLRYALRFESSDYSLATALMASLRSYTVPNALHTSSQQSNPSPPDFSRSALITLLNEAVRLRDSTLYRATLDSLLQDQGLQPDQYEGSEEDRLLALLTEAHSTLRDAHYVSVLLRCLAVFHRMPAQRHLVDEPSTENETAPAKGTKGNTSSSPTATSSSPTTTSSSPMTVLPEFKITRLVGLLLPGLVSGSPLTPKLREEEERVLADAHICSALLNALNKHGARDVAVQVWRKLNNFIDSSPASSSRMITPEEATCYFQSLEDAFASSSPNFFRVPYQYRAKLAADSEAARTRSSTDTEEEEPKSDDDVVTLLRDLRHSAMESVDWLFKHWQSSRSSHGDSAEELRGDERFYNAVLGALGWTRSIRIMRSGAEIGPITARQDRSDVSDPKYFSSAMASPFSSSSLSLAEYNARSVEIAQRFMLADEEAVRRLLYLLSAMRQQGMVLPPGYRWLISRLDLGGLDRVDEGIKALSSWALAASPAAPRGGVKERQREINLREGRRSDVGLFQSQTEKLRGLLVNKKSGKGRQRQQQQQQQQQKR